MGVGTSSFIPKDISISGSTNALITNLTLINANTEYPLTLQTALKQLIIKCRGAANMKISFVSGESGTKYITIYKGSVLALDALTFTGKTLYIQSPTASVIAEILELY